MRVLLLTLIACCVASPAVADHVESIISANHAASGGPAWDNKSTLKLEYSYSGEGLTGTSSFLKDLKRGAFIDAFDIPPTRGATGFDGIRAWEKEPSGTISDQSGGDVIPLAITESYMDRHLWWKPNWGGARLVDEGQKTAGGHSYDVLSITPIGGTSIEAWFDASTHLLFRTIEPNDTQIMTSTYSDYAPVEGAMIARKLVLDDGSGDLQTYTLTSARFAEPLPLQTYRKPADDLHDFSIAEGARETTVPFRMVSDNHIYADVSVNGSKPMTFEFDTGGHYIITPEAAKQLGIKPVGTTTSDGGGDTRVETGQATVKSVRVGGATVTQSAGLHPSILVPCRVGNEGRRNDRLRIPGALRHQIRLRAPHDHVDRQEAFRFRRRPARRCRCGSFTS